MAPGLDRLLGDDPRALAQGYTGTGTPGRSLSPLPGGHALPDTCAETGHNRTSATGSFDTPQQQESKPSELDRAADGSVDSWHTRPAAPIGRHALERFPEYPRQEAQVGIHFRRFPSQTDTRFSPVTNRQCW
jgi:hypothetical protein